VRLLTDDTEKTLTSSRCRGAISRYRYINVGRTSTKLTMADNKDIREREKIVRETKKTTESIRIKHRVLKTVRSKKISRPRVILNRSSSRYKRLLINSSMRAIKDESRGDDVETSFAQKDIIQSKMKRKRENTSVDYALSESHKLMRHTSNDVMDLPAITFTPRTIEAAKLIKDEDVFETMNNSFTTSVQHQMQTSEGREALSQHLDPLGQEYIGNFLSGDGKNKIIDTVYGIRLDKGIMMLGSKKFNIDSSDHIIVCNMLAH